MTEVYRDRPTDRARRQAKARVAVVVDMRVDGQQAARIRSFVRSVDRFVSLLFLSYLGHPVTR